MVLFSLLFIYPFQDIGILVKLIRHKLGFPCHGDAVISIDPEGPQSF